MGHEKIQQAFADGLRHYQAGRLDDAIAAFRNAFDLGPDYWQACYNLGNALREQGRVDEAVACFRRSIDLRPDLREAHDNLAILLQSQGRLDEAAGCFRRALELDPGRAEAHRKLGSVLVEQGKPDEAAGCFRKAIDLEPELPETHNNLGAVFVEQRRLDEAAGCFRSALKLRPNFPEAWNNLGAVLNDQNHPDDAIASFRTALALRPAFAEVYNNLGNALKSQGRVDEATSCFRKAVDLDPEFPEPHSNLGNLLTEQGRLDEAVACCRAALALKPAFPEAHYNLGNGLREQELPDEAIVCYGTALKLKPNFAEARCNLGNLLRNKGLLDEATACFRTALDLKPDYAEAHFNLATVLLAQGDMAAGWKEYEWRWQTPHMIRGRRAFTQPQWYGEAAAGCVLLIHAEQGFGDTLQFCRYAALAAARGLRVVLEVQAPLVRLLRSIPGLEQVVARGEALPGFDLHCLMLSLPLAFGTTLATIPAATAYLQADPLAAADWRTRLDAMDKPGLRVGLVWAGNPYRHALASAAVDARRSIAPDRLAPLFAVPGVHFVSLQRDGPAAPASFALTDFMTGINDFADTAALIANLDLVVSVDSAVAHLAAALGRPVWMLDRFDPCWRWLTGRRDSPWYPTLRLYRQPQPGDWTSVLAEVAGDLRALVETDRNGCKAGGSVR